MDTHKLLETNGLIPHETDTTKKLIGKKISRLTILAIGKKTGSYRYVAICSCECGTPHFIARLDKITSNHTQSCGCLHADSVVTHGRWRHPLFAVWKGIFSRCGNKKDRSYPRYGGRGIKISERWIDLESFISDMEPTYQAGLQLERIDNDGDYCPENCRWATHSEQQRNKSSNIRITINGKTKVLAEWCVDYGIKYQLAWERITVRGWDPLKALTLPAKR